MIVYYIKNLINGKHYVGQTIKPKFNMRYSGGRWWDETDNPYLKYAAKKYGKENFEVKILEKGVENIDKLNELEKHYAIVFNSYKPNGYNLVECGGNKGRKLLPWQKELISERASKKYFLRKTDTWELVEIFNLSKFCRERGIKSSGIYNMICKRDNVLECDGFCLPETTKEQLRDRYKRKFKGKVFELIKNEVTYLMEDIRGFCSKHDLEKGSFMKLLKKEMLYYKGFRLKERENEKPTRQKYYSFVSPEGEIFNGYNVSDFCREKKLSISKMNLVLRGERKTSGGWTRNPNFTPPDESNTQNSPDNPVSSPASSPIRDS
jgi:hypothetical protein